MVWFTLQSYHWWSLETQELITAYIYVMNATSVAKPNAFQQLRTDTDAIGANIIIDKEIWLTWTHAVDAFSIPSFVCFRKSRVGRWGGGVCTFVKHELKAFQIDVHSLFPAAEDLWFNVRLLNWDKVIICACYHPPKPVYDSVAFRKYFKDTIVQLLRMILIVYLFYQVNSIHLTLRICRLNLDVAKLLTYLRHGANILDVFFTNRPDLFKLS